MSHRVVDVESLSPEERLRLIGDLWDSLKDSGGSAPLSPAQELELDRRLGMLESDTSDPAGIPWQEVLDQIRRRRK